MHTDGRKVDKTGCIRFDGKQYEVGMDLIGQAIELYFDPLWTDEIEIRHKSKEPFKVKVFEIGENCGVKKQLPPVTIKANSSRMLDGLNKANISNRTKKATAVNYRSIGGADK
jgi:hypothetical protein